MTGARRFSLSSPDWGQDHLSLDAIVAYVDDELTAGPHTRAAAHLSDCAECRAEVVVQRQARTALRAACGPCLPSSLLRSLRSIPVEAELPPPPPGLGITADGQFVLLRDVPRAATESDPDGAPAEIGQGGGRWLSRRARVGAVSGLAIGALAVGALAVPGAGPFAQGVLGGPVLGVPVQGVSVQGVSVQGVPVQARLSAAQAVPAVSPAVVDRSARATDAVDDTASSSAATPDDTSAVLDPRVRARLDRSPVAFFRTP